MRLCVYDDFALYLCFSACFCNILCAVCVLLSLPPPVIAAVADKKYTGEAVGIMCHGLDGGTVDRCIPG